VFDDLERLKQLSREAGRIQFVYAGKAHPADQDGKEVIRRIFEARDRLRGEVTVAYMANYDISLAKAMTTGVDVWLNTPQPPMEASGTSGMKAALNGVPSLSVMDGWWIEGCIEGVTGWAIGHDHHRPEQAINRREDADNLYLKLEKVIRCFYEKPDRYLQVMLHAIALNGSFFNTQRMMQQYVVKAYFG
jgi:starch phosphorylase